MELGGPSSLRWETVSQRETLGAVSEETLTGVAGREIGPAMPPRETATGPTAPRQGFLRDGVYGSEKTVPPL
jgi:hypothetical protein